MILTISIHFSFLARYDFAHMNSHTDSINVQATECQNFTIIVLKMI